MGRPILGLYVSKDASNDTSTRQAFTQRVGHLLDGFMVEHEEVCASIQCHCRECAREGSFYPFRQCWRGVAENHACAHNFMKLPNVPDADNGLVLQKFLLASECSRFQLAAAEEGAHLFCGDASILIRDRHSTKMWHG
jgi:hypothetical protein